MQKIILLFVSILFSAECFSAPATDPVTLSATHGYVYVQMPRGLHTISKSPFLTLLDVKTGTEHPLRMRPVSSGVKALGAWLPQGEYKLGKWVGTSLGDYPVVSVQAGHMTDLGQLVAVAYGGYDIVVLPLRTAESAEGRASVFDELGAALSATKVIEWTSPNLPKSIEPIGRLHSAGSNMHGLLIHLLDHYERNKARPALIKQVRSAESIAQLLQFSKSAMLPRTEEPAIDGQGNLYYGAELGQIRMRKPGGEWSTLDTGSLRTVTAVEAHETTLVAGFDNGKIRISKDGGLTWSLAASLERDEAVVDIDRSGARWIVTARSLNEPNEQGAGSTLKQVNVYASAQGDFSDIARIHSVVAGPADFRNITTVRGEAFADAYYLNVAPNLTRLDTKTMTWTPIPAPSDITVFHVSPSTEILTGYNAKGMFSKLHVSTDRGATWKKLDTPSYVVHDIYFENADEARALRYRMSGMAYEYELVQYKRANDSWSRSNLPPAGCEAILADEKHVFRFCVTPGGSILANTNGKWEIEFANE